MQIKFSRLTPIFTFTSQSMNRVIYGLSSWQVALALVLSTLIASPALAQVDSWVVANCPLIKVPPLRTTVDLCNAHEGCSAVVSSYQTCPRVQKLLETLEVSMSAAPSGLVGLFARRQITPEALWQANLPDAVRVLESRPEWKEKIDIVSRLVPAGAGLLDVQRGTAGTAVELAYAFPSATIAPRNGAVTVFTRRGSMLRGVYISGRVEAIDKVGADGSRVIVFFKPDGSPGQGRSLEGNGNQFVGSFLPEPVLGATYAEGVQSAPDGRRWEGVFAGSTLRRGKSFRSNGTLDAEGEFAGGYGNVDLSVGKRYDETGTTVVENVDKPKAQANAAAAAREAADRQRRDQEAAKAAQEAQYKNTLANSNAGQLFALAEQFAAAGDAAKAREARLALISRFPNHPMAATAAQQMAGTIAAPAASNASASPSARPTAGAGLSCRDAMMRLNLSFDKAGDEDRFLNRSGRTSAQMIEQGVWRSVYLARAVTEIPQCANDAATRRYFIDDDAAVRRNCPARAGGPANCTTGANYYIDERQVQAVFQQLMGASALAGGQATGTGATSQPSSCATNPQESFRRFNKEMSDFSQSKPNSPPTSSTGSGARAQNQYAFYYGTEALVILEKYRSCLSAADYAANKTALEGMRDNGRTGCERLSTSPGSCTATYPAGWPSR